MHLTKISRVDAEINYLYTKFSKYKHKINHLRLLKRKYQSVVRKKNRKVSN